MTAEHERIKNKQCQYCKWFREDACAWVVDFDLAHRGDLEWFRKYSPHSLVLIDNCNSFEQGFKNSFNQQ